MCRLNASHCCLVVDKGCRLSPSTSLSSSWFLLLAYIAPVVGIHRTRRLIYLWLAYIAPAVRIHCTHLLLIQSIYIHTSRYREQFYRLKMLSPTTYQTHHFGTHSSTHGNRSSSALDTRYPSKLWMVQTGSEMEIEFAFR